MDAERIAEIRGRCEAATAGPWQHETVEYAHLVQNRTQELLESIDLEDARFTAHARQDVPDLLDALEAATNEVSRLKSGFAVVARVLAEENYGAALARLRTAEWGYCARCGASPCRCSHLEEQEEALEAATKRAEAVEDRLRSLENDYEAIQGGVECDNEVIRYLSEKRDAAEKEVKRLRDLYYLL